MQRNRKPGYYFPCISHFFALCADVSCDRRFVFDFCSLRPLLLVTRSSTTVEFASKQNCIKYERYELRLKENINILQLKRHVQSNAVMAIVSCLVLLLLLLLLLPYSTQFQSFEDTIMYGTIEALKQQKSIHVSQPGLERRGDGVVQLVERRTKDPKTLGSNPVRSRRKICESFYK